MQQRKVPQTREPALAHLISQTNPTPSAVEQRSLLSPVIFDNSPPSETHTSFVSPFEAFRHRKSLVRTAHLPFSQTSGLAPAHTPLLLGANWLRGSLARAHLSTSPFTRTHIANHIYKGVSWSSTHLDWVVASQASPSLSRERCSSPSYRYLHPILRSPATIICTLTPPLRGVDPVLARFLASRTLVQGLEKGLKIRAKENCILSAAAPASPPAPYPLPFCRHRALRFFFLPPSPQAGDFGAPLPTLRLAPNSAVLVSASLLNTIMISNPSQFPCPDRRVLLRLSAP